MASGKKVQTQVEITDSGASPPSVVLSLGKPLPGAPKPAEPTESPGDDW